MTPVIQDLALVVNREIRSADLIAVIKEAAGPLLEEISLFDRYDKLGDEKVSLAFTLTFRAQDRTLTAEEVAVCRETAVRAAEAKFGAQLRA